MDCFIGEIRIVALDYAPSGWAHCDGQLLPISQHTALYWIIGTTYGGDGVTTFALPDLRDRVPLHPGSGPGLTPRQLGTSIGAPATQLTADNLPSHTHGPLKAATSAGTADLPAGRLLAGGGSYAPSADTAMATTAPAAGEPFSVIQPFVALNFIIALEGIFPSAS